jgi:hypothetical protein
MVDCVLGLPVHLADGVPDTSALEDRFPPPLERNGVGMVVELVALPKARIDIDAHAQAISDGEIG